MALYIEVRYFHSIWDRPFRYWVYVFFMSLSRKFQQSLVEASAGSSFPILYKRTICDFCEVNCKFKCVKIKEKTRKYFFSFSLKRFQSFVLNSNIFRKGRRLPYFSPKSCWSGFCFLCSKEPHVEPRIYIKINQQQMKRMRRHGSHSFLAWKIYVRDMGTILIPHELFCRWISNMFFNKFEDDDTQREVKYWQKKRRTNKLLIIGNNPNNIRTLVCGVWCQCCRCCVTLHLSENFEGTCGTADCYICYLKCFHTFVTKCSSMHAINVLPNSICALPPCRQILNMIFSLSWLHSFRHSNSYLNL